MSEEATFYICPVCFLVCDSERQCHQHRTLLCEPGPLGDERRKPVRGQFGEYVSRAPRWYLEAIGRIES